MSRPAARDNSTAVSLFPFLAVLLCTMGALIVLLVAMAHAASQRAAMLQLAEQQPQAAAPEADQPPPEPATASGPDPALADRLQAANDRGQKLEQLKAQAAEALRDNATRLSHIEDHIGRLREQLVALKRAELQLADLDNKYQDERDSAEAELDRLKQLIAEVEEEVEQLESEQRSKPKSYAIVPYKGPNGTRRRPIYIECRGGEVLLQPEGVKLDPIDFRPPLGVGNPLSAALRASRKHFERANPALVGDPDSAPYPLILVRPSGIQLYHRVRAALESGDSEFGYEMIDEDWDLSVGLPNPVLASKQAEAIDRARLRRSLLSRAAPSVYEEAGGQDYSLADARAGRGAGGGQLGAEGEFGGGGDVGPGGGSAPSGQVGSPYSADDTLRYGAAGSEQPAGSRQPQQGTAFADNPSGQVNPYGAFAGAAAPATEGSSANSAGNPYAQLLESQGGAGAATLSGAGKPGEAGAAAQQGSGQASGQASGQPGGSPGGQPAGTSGSPTVAAEFGPRQPQGQAGAGGGGGGSQRRRDDLPIRRPISLVVYGDRVAVTPIDENGQAIMSAAEVLPFEDRTAYAAPGVASAVDRQVRAWGIAGRGFYWKPVLVLSVAPSGDQRADELVALLGRRGIEVRYHNTAARPDQEAPRAQR